MGKERKLTWRFLIICCAVFFLLWGVTEIILFPMIEDPQNGWAEALKESAVKLLVWTLPAILLIRYFEQDMWLSLKGMLTNRTNWRPFLAVIAGMITLNMINAYRSWGRIGVHEGFEAASLIGTVLFVGVTEEAVFRGWLLNAALKKLPYRAALLSVAALFVLIHFPIWIRTGRLNDLWTVLCNCASIFCLSLLFSWAFAKSKNLFVPIVLHMSWNLGIVLFRAG